MPHDSSRARARSWLDATLRAARVAAGAVPRRPAVPEQPHTVLLGWSGELLAVLAALPELAGPGPDRRWRGLVVLADRDRGSMSRELASQLRAHPGRTGRPGGARVACRSGDPTDPDEIAAVHPDRARAVIVLPAGDTPDDRDARLVKALLAVTRGHPEAVEPPRLVGRVCEPANLPAARLAGGPDAQLVDTASLVARMVVQTCRQPGLAVVCTRLLEPGADEIHVREDPALVGHTYGQVLHAYRTAAVIGLRTADGRVALGPHSQTPIRPGDAVVAIAPDAAALAPAVPPAPVVQPAILAHPDPPPGRTRALLLGWNTRAARVLGQLDQQLPPGSEVSVVTRHPGAAPGLAELTGRVHNLVLTFKEDEPGHRAVLESLGVDSYDQVVVLGGDRQDDPAGWQLADARTLTTQLHLHGLGPRPGTGRFSVVCELADHRNLPLARITRAEDVVAGEWLVCLLLARLAGDPTRAAAYAGMCDPAGPALQLKAADRYVQTGQPVNFQTVVEAARWRWETALGYRVAALAHQPPGYGVVLNPDKAAPLTLHPHDQIVVLAET